MNVLEDFHTLKEKLFSAVICDALDSRGCVGTLVHGAVRDVSKMKEMHFPVFATAKCIYDSLHRQRVIDMDIPVEIDGVIFSPGDLVYCDEDGVVVIPQAVEKEVIAKALKKVSAENVTRDEIKRAMKAAEAYKKYGVL